MSASIPGVFRAQKKDGTAYFRASITFKGKHISLGSFGTEKEAGKAYLAASQLLNRSDKSNILDYDHTQTPLSLAKWVMLINLRDNGIYCRGPIYLRSDYFEYYLDFKQVLRFGAQELFYYTNHGIQRRGGHLFVSDYGSQLNILNRYGIPSHSVRGRDYYFKNGDENDFRPGNIVIINHYHGVSREMVKGKPVYTSRIHVNGDMIIGRYDNETDAAIAYNKAAGTLRANGFEINYTENYIDDISEAEYLLRYRNIRISKRIRQLKP